MNQGFDAIVVGAGQAGPALVAKLAGVGQKVALVERRHLGGSCVNFGCTPTKAMVASARAAWAARHAGELGVRIAGEVSVDMAAVKERTARIVEASRSGLREWLESLDGVTLISGHARFSASDRVRVKDEEYVAKRLFIDTGSRPVIPPIPGLDEGEYWTASRLVAVDHLPEHLIVLGGGAIGVEFAQMFRRFGSRVTVVERHARLLGQEDTDVSDAVQQLLEAEGVDVRVAAAAKRVQHSDAGVTLSLDQGEAGMREIRGTHLLVAVGRRPNSDDLGLEEAGVATDADGYIRVDDQLHTNVDGIWALGDVNGRGAFTHTAYDDYEIVADELFGHNARSLKDRITAYAVYTDPPLGRVGRTEAQTRGAGDRVLLAKLPMRRVARARERGETRGFMKVLVDAETDLLLGAAIVGISGDEVVHNILNLMHAGVPYPVLRDAVGIHPTVSEFLPSLLDRLEPMAPRAGDKAAGGGS